MAATTGLLICVIPKSNHKIVWRAPSTRNPVPFRLEVPTVQMETRGLRGTVADSTGGSAFTDAGGELRFGHTKEVIHLPEHKQFRDAAEAMDWLDGVAPNLDRFVNKNLSLADQALQMVHIQRALVEAATSAIADGNARGRFATFFPVKSFNDLKAEALRNNLSGDAMHQFIYNRAKEHTLSSSMGCFIKGTLVETPEGWTPIDELKVGDWVLSRPENGMGEAVPKRVTNTFVFENKEIWSVVISDEKRERHLNAWELAVTPNHPFCVYGVATNLYYPDDPELTYKWEQFSCQEYEEYEFDPFDHDENSPEATKNPKLHAYMQGGRSPKYDEFKKTPYEITLFEQPIWKRVDQLQWGDVVKDSRNNYCVVQIARPYAAVPDSNWGWVQDSKRRVLWQQEPMGNYVDFSMGEKNRHVPQFIRNEYGDFYTRNDESLICQDEDGKLHYQPYCTTVYNIEVEDYHTYCVGRTGILVHNTNCGQTKRDAVQIRSKADADKLAKSLLEKYGSWQAVRQHVQGSLLMVNDQMSLEVRLDKNGSLYMYKDKRDVGR